MPPCCTQLSPKGESVDGVFGGAVLVTYGAAGVPSSPGAVLICFGNTRGGSGRLRTALIPRERNRPNRFASASRDEVTVVTSAQSSATCC